MKQGAEKLFRSFVDGSKMRLVSAHADSYGVKNGTLIAGDQSFEIKDYIPRFVPSDNYTSNFGYQWKKYSKTQLDSYAGIRLSHNRVKEVLGTDISLLNNSKVLEAGSGAGRFTEVFLSSGCDLYSFDYSEAVEANRDNNGFDFHLFQASIYEIPLEKENFDKVFCLGVIQHTPDPSASFECLSEQVKPGGKLYIDVYEKRAYSFFTWKYLLRPMFKLLPQSLLHRLVHWMVTLLLPISTLMGKMFGRLGHKLFPIANFFIVPFKNYQERWVWSMLDTFDWYGPAYDLPQTSETISKWFTQAGYIDIEVYRGSNGVIGRGTKPLNKVSNFK